MAPTQLHDYSRSDKMPSSPTLESVGVERRTKLYGDYKLEFWVRSSDCAGMQGERLQMQSEVRTITVKDKHEKQDLLGFELWSAGDTLSQVLSEHPGCVEGKAVLELGAGLGLPGILAAKMGASSVLLTDHEPEVTSLLQMNIDLNNVDRTCQAAMLDWEAPEPSFTQQHWDVVLAADVCYFSRLAAPLAKVVMEAIGEDGVLLFGHQVRKAVWWDRVREEAVEDEGDEPLDAFLKGCSEGGLTVKQIRRSAAQGHDTLVYAISMSQSALEAVQSSPRQNGRGEPA